MTLLSHTADGTGHIGSVSRYVRRDHDSVRASVLDRLDRPRAVFAVLGAAAVVGLALAYTVVHGLERFGGARQERQHASSAARAPSQAPAARSRNPSVGEAVSPALQYQAPNVATAPAASPSAALNAPTGSAPAVAPNPSTLPSVPPAAGNPPAQMSPAPVTANPMPQARFKLTAPFIPPIARSARSSMALAAPPQIAPSPPALANASPPTRSIAPAPSPAPAPSAVTQAPVPAGRSPNSTAAVSPPAPPVIAQAPAVARPAAPPITAAPPVPPPHSAEISPAATPPLEAERRIAPVLNAAARADDPAHERAVLEAAENVRRADAARRTGADSVARRLNEEANRAYWIKKDVAEALQLERRAFEVNPGDVEIAGNLAFYYLKQSPPHPEAAREVALHALTASSPRYRTGRLEDWMSLGIASALMGRRQESENAFLAGAALGNNLDRTCRAALTAVATYGDAVRPAATALLRRVREHGRSNESPYCAWPPDWSRARPYP